MNNELTDNITIPSNNNIEIIIEIYLHIFLTKSKLNLIQILFHLIFELKNINIKNINNINFQFIIVK